MGRRALGRVEGEGDASAGPVQRDFSPLPHPTRACRRVWIDLGQGGRGRWAEQKAFQMLTRRASVTRGQGLETNPLLRGQLLLKVLDDRSHAGVFSPSGLKKGFRGLDAAFSGPASLTSERHGPPPAQGHLDRPGKCDFMEEEGALWQASPPMEVRKKTGEGKGRRGAPRQAVPQGGATDGADSPAPPFIPHPRSKTPGVKHRPQPTSPESGA